MQSKANSANSQTSKTADTKTAVHPHVPENKPVGNGGAELVQAGSESRKTQRARILRLLVEAHGAWIPLSAILELGIAQYGARIFELRRLGFLVENRTERDDSGAVHSWYRLVAALAAAKPEPVKREWKDRPGLTGLPLWDLAVSR